MNNNLQGGGAPPEVNARLARKYGPAWSTILSAPLFGARTFYESQAKNFTDPPPAAPRILFSQRYRAEAVLQGLWITSTAFEDLYSIEPRILLNGTPVNIPGDVMSFMHVGEGLGRLFKLEMFVEKNSQIIVQTQTMFFYNNGGGSLVKSFGTIMRGWYV